MIGANAQVGQRLANVVEASARQADVLRMILSAGDDARLVVGGQPHRLRLVELGILERRQAKQPVSETRMQPVFGDVDLIAEDQFQMSEAVRRQSAAPCGAATAAPSTARRLRRLAAAAARRGSRPRRSASCDDPLRPALGRSCARSRETPIGRPMGRGRHRGRRCCPARAVRFCSGKAIRLPNPPCGSVS